MHSGFFKNTRKALHESLKKLGLDYVDLYLIHSPSGKQVVETWREMVRRQLFAAFMDWGNNTIASSTLVPLWNRWWSLLLIT